MAGTARGRRLAPPAPGTRPTSDRMREALFNSLVAQVELEGARVLDLFAGTGAVGLEALSRGAGTAVFVESGRAAVEVLRRNITTVGLPGAEVHRRSVAAFLTDRAGADPFQLVFADPPYAATDTDVDEMLSVLDRGRWLAADAVLVVERSVRSPGPRWSEHIEATRERRYGDSVLWYGRRR